MGRVIRVTCGKCSGCPALPLTREQYRQVYRLTLEGGTPEDIELAEQFLAGEVVAVYCCYQEKTVLCGG